MGVSSWVRIIEPHKMASMAHDTRNIDAPKPSNFLRGIIERDLQRNDFVA